MTNFSRFTPKNILRAILLAIFPWIPPVLFEKTDFYFHLRHKPDWYYNISEYRLFFYLVWFAFWGIVVRFILRPRWAVFKLALNSFMFRFGVCVAFLLYD